ncbi:UNVERIFIED_CONTAM: hypothetical protein HDU68_001027 [Siphonaria sp. JEL0065]|nr:hypothetical protein HDU68_001027 [Siphonaria sp. JEL0065]
MTISSPIQAYQTASEFWAASDALRGLASVAASRDGVESNSPPSATAASPALSPTTTPRMLRGPGGINLMDEIDSETNQHYETSFMNSEMNGLITPIYLQQRQLPAVISSPSIMIVTQDTRSTQQQQQLPVLLSHSYQTQQEALRHQELRFRMQEGYRQFQPLHSPIMVHAVPPPPPPPYMTRPPPIVNPVSMQSPFSCGPQVFSIPQKTHQPQQQASMYHTPIRATLRGFKRPKQMYKCTWVGCTKEFAKPSLLKSHINIHQSIKPFECKHCTQAFARNHDLRRHERCVHAMGGKEAQCRGCNRMFTRVDSCRFHEKTCHFVAGAVAIAGSEQQVLAV